MMNFYKKLAIISIVSLLVVVVGYGEEAGHNKDVVYTQEGVMTALRQKYDSEIIKIYSIYDIENSRSILVCVDSKNEKCFVSFSGRDLFIRCRFNGKIEERSGFFTPEVVLATVGGNDIRFENADGSLTKEFDAEIGFWFAKPKSESVKILLSSSDGDFVIDWRKDENTPKVYTY